MVVSSVHTLNLVHILCFLTLLHSRFGAIVIMSGALNAVENYSKHKIHFVFFSRKGKERIGWGNEDFFKIVFLNSAWRWGNKLQVSMWMLTDGKRERSQYGSLENPWIRDTVPGWKIDDQSIRKMKSTAQPQRSQ